jgi:hypothetical protein
MADPHGQSSATSHDAHAPEEDVVRTPLWLPFIGIALLLLGSVFAFRLVHSGTSSGSTTSDAGVEAGAPSPAPAAAPAPGGAAAQEPAH